VEPFLRFVEANFWSKWWQKGARELSLNDYVNLTWTYAPPVIPQEDSGTIVLYFKPINAHFSLSAASVLAYSNHPATPDERVGERQARK